MKIFGIRDAVIDELWILVLPQGLIFLPIILSSVSCIISVVHRLYGDQAFTFSILQNNTKKLENIIGNNIVIKKFANKNFVKNFFILFKIF